MKTAVSIPDRLFKQADRHAKMAKITRSELYARALRAYLLKHSRELLAQQADEYAKKDFADKMTDVLAAGEETLRGVEW